MTLIIGAWNEPLMLTFGPLVPAVAAGNTAVIKPSEFAALRGRCGTLVPKYFDQSAVAVVEGAVPETTALLEQHWDLIFFTGSPQVGQIIHQAAAKHLTPCVLELGGKNPTIVHSSADLKAAARRIAYGRYINAGHICTAPDHVLVWPEVKDEFMRTSCRRSTTSTATTRRRAPTTGASSTARASTDSRGCSAAAPSPPAATDLDDNYVAPTVLVDPALDSPIMQEESSGRSCPCSKSLRSKP